jgi:hypothetical protein
VPVGAAEKIRDFPDGDVATADKGLRVGATVGESALDGAHDARVELIERNDHQGGSSDGLCHAQVLPRHPRIPGTGAEPNRRSPAVKRPSETMNPRVLERRHARRHRWFHRTTRRAELLHSARHRGV